ncbi:B-box zinc finger protein 22-like [Tasmannia lanceolata]|uniref:B-box zinc finger protein 22-like n=1 Tax=Tasmannia lanceolata TaxID=3420 RepID=UPI004062EEFC
MKIQCDVCEKAEATLLCCADEAALCWECDQKVHAANKLAGKHRRLPLLSPPSPGHHIPNCDICQEKAGYFFCLEDRALLCRQCDLSIHTASPYVSSHQRFLVTGVKVALQQQQHSSPPSNGSLVEYTNKNVSSTTTTATYSGENMSGFHPHWPLDEILGRSESDRGYGFSELGSSRISSQ